MANDINKSESPINQSSASVRVVHQPTPLSGDSRCDGAYILDWPLRGWPQVAEIIQRNPSLGAFEAFRELHVKSLLYYQAELVLLREKPHAVEYEDCRTGEARGVKGASTFGTDLASLLASRDNKDPKLREQWTLMTQIRDVLKEYGIQLPLPQKEIF
jgi:hypothetical protein